MKRPHVVIVFLITTLAGCSGSKDEKNVPDSITPFEAAKILEDGADAVFLDVRSSIEYAGETGHVRGAILIPVDSLLGRLTELEAYKSKTIVVYCRMGGRSARAQRILTEHGYRALNVLGGIIRWNKEQLPVVRE